MSDLVYRVENKSRNPITFDLLGVEGSENLPEGWDAVEFGDPNDYSVDAPGLAKPILEIPESVWEVLYTRYSKSIEGMIERGDLIVH